MKQVILVFILGFLGLVFAQNQTVSVPVGPSPDVTTAFVLPDHPAKGTFMALLIYLLLFATF